MYSMYVSPASTDSYSKDINEHLQNMARVFVSENCGGGGRLCWVIFI